MNSKNKTTYYTSFPTPIGRIYLAGTSKGLCRVSWGYRSEKDFVREVRSLPPNASPVKTFGDRSIGGQKPALEGFNQGSEVRSIVKDDLHFAGIKNDIKKYLSGEPVSFKKYALVLEGTAFRKKVWRALAGIQYGKVLTYKEVAKKIGSPWAFRAVGSACGKNELPILIPCHRVISSDGSLGGFSGGLRLKRYLLELEGVGI